MFCIDRKGPVSYHAMLTPRSIRAEKNIDLLQALLLHLAWYHHHSVLNPQITNLIALAKALVTNLSIHRPPHGRDQTCLPVTSNGSGGPPPQGTLAEPSQETVEEWRALAGCYYLSSLTTTCWNNAESLTYTQYLGRVCDRLEAIKFQDSDVVVALLVRLQYLASKIHGSLYTEDVPSPTAMTSSRMLIHTFKENLQTFFDSIPAPFQTHRVLRLNYESTLVSLYEPSIHQHCALEKSVRIGMLSACLQHTRETLTRLTSLVFPLSIASSYIMFSHLGYLMTVGLRLSTLQVEGWNLQEARSILKLDEIGTALASFLQQLIETRVKPGEKGDSRDIYLCFLRSLGRKRQIYAASEVRGNDAVARTPLSAPSNIKVVSPSPLTYDAHFDDLMLPDLDPNSWNTFFDYALIQDGHNGLNFSNAGST